MVDRFAVDWRSAGLDDATVGLLDFAEKLTNECATVTGADIDELRAHGFDDAGISSCVQVISYFNYINRIAEGLGVLREDWIEDDGHKAEDGFSLPP